MDTLVLENRSYHVKEIKQFQNTEDFETIADMMDEYYYVIVNDVQDMERLWQLQKTSIRKIPAPSQDKSDWI